MGGQVKMNRLLYGSPLVEDMKPKLIDCPHCKGQGQLTYWADTGDDVTQEEYLTHLNSPDEREIITEVCEHCQGSGTQEIWEEVEERDMFNEVRYYESKYR